MNVDENGDPAKRLTLVVEGHVQGVGFRFSTVAVAQRHNVRGFVRNEPDGTVSVVAEGSAKQLFRFLDDLRKASVYRFVCGEQVSWSTATCEYHDFGIRYG